MTVEVTVPAPGELLGAVRSVVADADDALLCVAFANEAGVNLLEPALAASRGRVRMLATTVFGDTTATALSRAASLGVDVRVLNRRGGTYHPKLYLAQRGRNAVALVGSANLTSGLLRNIEVAALLQGAADASSLSRLREQAEGWWADPVAEQWSPDLAVTATDTFRDDLWAQLREALTPGGLVTTLAQGHPNRIVEISRDAVWIETARSRGRGRGAEEVPAWMFNIAWDYLMAHGRLSNRYLLSSDGLNVKRSSAVCAVLARLPAVEVASQRPIELRRRPVHAPGAAAEKPGPYTVRPPSS